jgi:beta-lactamase superfamily II metal-dependent hydrolase
MLTIEMLNAAHGDAIWVEYGDVSEKHRILIDGGPAHTYSNGIRRRIEHISENRKIDLFVVTHIDADHIDGALILLQDRERLDLEVNEVWFNTWNHLPETDRDSFAPLQGEFLGALLHLDGDLREKLNRAFNNEAIYTGNDSSRPLPHKALPGGASITLLGPDMRDLRRLRARWSAAIRDFSPGDSNEALRRLKERRTYRPPVGPAVFSSHNPGNDRSPANGSSIAFAFQYGPARILFTGDAHARTLEANIKRLCLAEGVAKVCFDAVKLPHHGSVGNVSKEWISMVDCHRWLISTNGDIFGHPDLETARLVHSNSGTVPTEFYCNYDTVTTKVLKQHESEGWKALYPNHGAAMGPAGGLLLTIPVELDKSLLLQDQRSSRGNLEPLHL